MKILNKFINFITYKEPNNYSFTLPNAERTSKSEPENKKIYPTLNVNLEYVKRAYSFDMNSDIKIREFYINIRGKEYSAFLLYIEGMIDSDAINKFLIKPLMLKNSSNTDTQDSEIVTSAVTHNVTVRRVKRFDLQKYILECLVPQNDVSTENKFQEAFQKVNARSISTFCRHIGCGFFNRC